MKYNEEQIINLFKNGDNFTQIALKLSLNRKTVSKIIKKNNLFTTIFKLNKQEIINKFINGLSINALAKEYCVDYSTIKKIVSLYSDHRIQIKNNKIINTFNKYRRIKDVKNKLSINYSTIKNTLINNNYIQINKMFFLPKEIDELIAANNINTVILLGKCKELKIKSLSTAYKILKTQSIQFKHRNKITINPDIFKIIDTQEKAYFLGLILTDGNVHKNTFSVLLKYRKVIFYNLK